MHVLWCFCFLFCSVFFFCVLVLKLKTERHKKRKLGKTPLARGYGVCFFESTRELYEHFIAVCLAGVWEYEKQNTYLRLLEAWRRASISFFVLVSKKNLGKKLYGGEKSHSRVFGLFFFWFFFCFVSLPKSGVGKKKRERKEKGACVSHIRQSSLGGEKTQERNTTEGGREQRERGTKSIRCVMDNKKPWFSILIFFLLL